jgi:hypothetical protein
MPVPSQSHITLVGGLNSTNSTIYTNSLIKTGDTIKVTGTTSNNSVYTVIDVVTTGSTGEKVGTTFTDATCDTTEDDATVTHDANAQIVAGLSVSGTGINTGATYIASITDSTHFEMNRPATADGTNVTLTFGDMDIYYCVKGGRLTDEDSGGDPQIEVVRAPGDKLVALGDVDSARGVDVWSNNATTDYIGTSPANADGWEASAISPTIQGDDAKYIYHFADEALRVCNINEENSSLIKWYGYIQRQQFNNVNGLIFAEWQEHPNNLAPPKIAQGILTYAYGTASHSGSTATNYYTTLSSGEGVNRGVVKYKEDTTTDNPLRLDGDHNATTTSFTFESTGDVDILDQSVAGEVISISNTTDDATDTTGTFPKEFLFCKKASGTSGDPITYSRAYGGALVGGTAPFADFADTDTPILERGLGWNIGVADGTAEGDWEAGTYAFYQSFIYDGNQESLPVKMGTGAAETVFAHPAAGQKSLLVSVYADLAYNGRITGGRIYTRIQNTDDDLVLLADIDIVKGVRTSLDGDHVAWTYQSGKGYYVVGDVVGNSTKPNLDTYTTINGFSPDVNFVAIGGAGELYKASVVANRRAFIANVKIKTKSGEVEKFGDRLMYSEIGKFDTFLEHNFIDVSKGDFGEYTAIESFADRLLAFKNNLVHIINIASPSVSNWYLEETVKYFGANFPFSVAKTKYGIAWVSDDGCYLYDGKSVRNLIDKKVAVSDASFTSINKPWNDWYRGTAHLKDVMLGYDSISNSLIMMRSPNDSTDYSEQSWVFDFDSKGWTYNKRIFTDSETYTNFITDWNNNLVLGYQNSTSITFQKYLPIGIAQQTQNFVTKDIDFGQPGLIKKIYKVIITYKSDTANTTPFQYAINGIQNFTGNGGGTFTGNFVDTTAISSNDGWDVVTLTTTSPISCQSIQIKCNAFSSSTGIFEINDMTIEYRVIRNKVVT